MPEAVYGSWSSPLGAESLSTGRLSFGDIGATDSLDLWIENRPAEGGRAVIVQAQIDGTIEDRIPAPYSARTSVHEYGGGAFCLAGDDVFFVNFSDQAVYRSAAAHSEPCLFTPGDTQHRYADLVFDARHQRLIAVCEYNNNDNTHDEPRNVLVSLRDGAPPIVIAQGADFIASPALSPDGRQLAWLQWYHPQMPWDGTELWIAELDEHGALHDARKWRGGPDESIFQPQWSPAGALHFVSDRSGWWNLYQIQSADSDRALYPLDAEFGMPQWVFGMSTYGFDTDGTLVASFRQNGQWSMAKCHPGQPWTALAIDANDIDRLRVCQGRVLFNAGYAERPNAITRLDVSTGKARTVRQSITIDLSPDDVSVAQPVAFPSTAGRIAHAFYYPPRNARFRAPAGTLPPLLVKSHGGPTASTSPALDLGIQYWTTRGFAVIDVNYAGSTGYGREYRRSLYGQWGIADVEDCAAAADYLIQQGQVDAAQCAIRGSSAGGYTTLAALTFTERFSAGASYYGISDLEILAKDTHKFESRYLDQLIGPYPQDRQTYLDRSPIYHCERLSAPVIFFQGELDKVVPPNQAEQMARALDDKGLAVAYLLFADERHGFRLAKTIRRTLEAELAFYATIFGFTPADPIAPIDIRNRPSR